MKFFKPKFWDENKISFFSIFFYPLAFLIKILTFLKKLLTEEKFYTSYLCRKYIFRLNRKNSSVYRNFLHSQKLKPKSCFYKEKI